MNSHETKLMNSAYAGQQASIDGQKQESEKRENRRKFTGVYHAGHDTNYIQFVVVSAIEEDCNDTAVVRECRVRMVRYTDKTRTSTYIGRIMVRYTDKAQINIMSAKHVTDMSFIRHFGGKFAKKINDGVRGYDDSKKSRFAKLIKGFMATERGTGWQDVPEAYLELFDDESDSEETV